MSLIIYTIMEENHFIIGDFKENIKSMLESISDIETTPESPSPVKFDGQYKSDWSDNIVFCLENNNDNKNNFIGGNILNDVFGPESSKNKTTMLLTANPQRTLFNHGNIITLTPYHSIIIPVNLYTDSTNKPFSINLSKICRQMGITLFSKIYLCFSKKINIDSIHMKCGNALIDVLHEGMIEIQRNLGFENIQNDSNEYIVPLSFFFRNDSHSISIPGTVYHDIVFEVKSNELFSDTKVRMLITSNMVSKKENDSFTKNSQKKLIMQWGMNYKDVTFNPLPTNDKFDKYTEIYKIELDFKYAMPHIFIKFDHDNKQYDLDVNGYLCFEQSGREHIIAYIDKTINMINYSKYATTHKNKNIYVIPFCKDPKMCETSPTGVLYGLDCDRDIFSNIIDNKNLKMHLKLNVAMMKQCYPHSLRIQVWGPRYNVIAYMSGMAGIAL